MSLEVQAIKWSNEVERDFNPYSERELGFTHIIHLTLHLDAKC